MSQWDLSELVSNPQDPSFSSQIKQVQTLARSFEKLKNKLHPTMSHKTFLKIISDMETLSEKMNMLGGYASLQYAANTQSDTATSLVTKMNKLGADISNQTLFFDLWWKQKIDQKNAQRLAEKSKDLAGYLMHKRLFAKYSLSEPEERIINTLDVTGISALIKLYDKITNGFKYTVTLNKKQKTMTREQLTTLVKSGDAKARKAAYRTLLTKYSDNKGVIGEIYQNIVLNWKNEGIQIRGYPSPISMRNIGNDVDDKTVNALLDTCQKNKGTFHKFFRQKAKILHLKKLQRYDLYAPLPTTASTTLSSRSKPKKGAAAAAQKNYSYDTAVCLVIESISQFSQTLGDFARKVFEQNHVDSLPRAGKRDGAFCSTISPDITPFVLINYTKKLRDVFTLAHELGHAIHSQAAQNHSILVQEAPLPLAETASTFSELLLYDKLSTGLSDTQKKGLLYEKIDDLYATIMRQSFFTLFEIDAHKQIGDGTTTEDISDTYMSNLKTQFGNSVSLSDDFAIEWSCIPHFYHSPFYCYAYSFGNLLALSLFQRYKKEGRDFVPAYIEILAAGGTTKPELLLRQYGLDIGSTRFWQAGFDYVDSQLSELCKIN